jgi:hypothetical protein
MQLHFGTHEKDASTRFLFVSNLGDEEIKLIAHQLINQQSTLTLLLEVFSS